jgi:hypothetical protein
MYLGVSRGLTASKLDAELVTAEYAGEDNAIAPVLNDLVEVGIAVGAHAEQLPGHDMFSPQYHHELRATISWKDTRYRTLERTHSFKTANPGDWYEGNREQKNRLACMVRELFNDVNVTPVPDPDALFAKFNPGPTAKSLYREM